MAEQKKRWKWLKRVLWSLLGFFVLLFIAVSVLVYIVNSESYLEDYLTENFGVEAQIGELDVSLLSGTIEISSSVIGPKDDPFIQFEQLQGELDYSRLWSSQLTVELLKLNNAKARYPFEFKIKETSQTGEDSSLPFDFIDVAAIDINNLDFEYRDFEYQDDVTLLAEGADIKVRNLPIAESGFLLFEDLDRLVKASQTTVEANLASLKSKKTQLNDIRLNAYVEQQKLIIEKIQSGESSINIDLVDYSDAAASSQQSKAQIQSQQGVQLDIPFDDVVIQTIDLGKTDLLVKDKEELSIKAIEANFSELLLVKDKKALWLDWPSFYNEQSSQFKLSSQVMKSSILDFNQLSLEGQLKQGQFILPSFQLDKPLLRLAQAAQTNPNQSEPDNNSWYLPFSTVRLESGMVTEGAVEFQQGSDKHQVSSIDLELTNLPLVLDHKPVFAHELINVGDRQALAKLKNATYSGGFGEIKQLSTEISLSNSSVKINKLNVSEPNIGYAASTKASQGSANADNLEVVLPVSDVMLEGLSVSNAQFDIAIGGEQYASTGVNLELNNIPIYQQKEWQVTRPGSWQQQAAAKVEAQSLNLPQGSLSGLGARANIQNNALTVKQLKLAGADLNINADASQQSAPIDLGIERVDLEAIDLNNVALNYKNGDIGYQLSGGNLSLSYYPLVRNGELVSDPVTHMQGNTNRIQLQAARIQTPEGTVNGLSAQGQLRNKDLMLDYLRTDSADIQYVATEGSSKNDTSEKTSTSEESATSKTTNKSGDFVFRTVKIGDLKLRGVDATITNNSEGDNTEELVIKDLYLGATELMLAKNHQTIDQWYGSQLENAFALIALKISHIQQNQNDIRDVTVTAVQADGEIKVQPLRLTYNDAPLSAKWIVDLTQQPYRSSFDSEFKNLQLEKLVEPADEESIAMSGALQGDIELTFNGLRADTIFPTLDGSLIVGNQSTVTLKRLNVNKVLRSFLDSQSFGLLDFGGFLLAGPLGLLASQGVSVQDTLSQLGADEGDTILPQLHADMSIAQGILQTKDVAAATEKYRFAFNGQINLAKQEFNDFRFDVINEKGCSEYGQTLNGSLTSPDIETFTAAFDAVTGSITGLFKQGVGLITGGACSAVYQGVVPHPKEGAVIIPQEQRRTIDPNAPEEESEEEPAEEEAQGNND